MIAAVQFTPILILSLASGALVDRLPRRRLLLSTYYATISFSLAMAVLVLTGRAELWHVYIYSFFVGLGTAFEGPARQALLAEAVGPARLQQALSLDQATFGTARVVAPAIGGVIISVWSAGWCFALNALLALPAIVTISLMRLAPVAFDGIRRSMRSDAVAGIRYALADPLLRMPLIVLLFVGLFGYNIGVWLPLFARDELHAGATGFGTMNVAIGVGSLAAAVVTTTGRPPSPARIAASAAAFGLLLAVASASPSIAVAVPILVLAGFMSITFTVSTSVALQMRTEDRFRGRVMSLFFLLFSGTTPLGSTLTGVLADAIGIRATIGTLGGACVVGALVGVAWLRRHADVRSVYRGMQSDA